MARNFQFVLRKNDTKGSSDNEEFQTSNWLITGVSTLSTQSGQTNSGNLSDDGQLYVTLSASSTQVAGRLYKSYSLGQATSLVGTFTATNQTSSFCTIAAANSSGLGGEVTVKYNAVQPASNPIKLQVVFSTDQDLSLYEDVRQFQSWHPTVGVALHQNEAAWVISDYIAHKFREHLSGLIGGAYGIDPNKSYPIINQFFRIFNYLCLVFSWRK